MSIGQAAKLTTGAFFPDYFPFFFLSYSDLNQHMP